MKGWKKDVILSVSVAFLFIFHATDGSLIELVVGLSISFFIAYRSYEKKRGDWSIGNDIKGNILLSVLIGFLTIYLAKSWSVEIHGFVIGLGVATIIFLFYRTYRKSREQC